MESSDILLALIAAFLPISWAATWVRLNRIEDKLAEKVDRTEFIAFRSEFQEEMAVQRTEMAQIRSDITQLAIALGQGGPRAL